MGRPIVELQALEQLPPEDVLVIHTMYCVLLGDAEHVCFSKFRLYPLDDLRIATWWPLPPAARVARGYWQENGYYRDFEVLMTGDVVGAGQLNVSGDLRLNFTIQGFRALRRLLEGFPAHVLQCDTPGIGSFPARLKKALDDHNLGLP